MENLKNISTSFVTRLFVLVLMFSSLYFIFDQIKPDYETFKSLENTLQDRQEQIISLKNEIENLNMEIEELDDPEKVQLILRRRGYGEPGEVLYRFEVPEPVTPIEETLQSNRTKSLIEYVVDYISGKEGG